MPPRASYKAFPILVRSHKLTIILDAPPDKKTVAQLKEEVLSALKSNVINQEDESEVPQAESVESVDDFELCRELKERRDRVVVPLGKFEALDESGLVSKQTSPYESLFLRFKLNGLRQKPEYTLPPVHDDDDEPDPEPSPDKGKRKAID